jgi:hypothetical protein
MNGVKTGTFLVGGVPSSTALLVFATSEDARLQELLRRQCPASPCSLQALWVTRSEAHQLLHVCETAVPAGCHWPEAPLDGAVIAYRNGSTAAPRVSRVVSARRAGDGGSAWVLIAECGDAIPMDCLETGTAPLWHDAWAAAWGEAAASCKQMGSVLEVRPSEPM